MKELEDVMNKKINPILDEAMKKYLGIKVSEVKIDISDRIVSNPLLGMQIHYNFTFKEAKRIFKKEFLERLIQTHHGNISEVARLTGVDRRSIHRIVDKDIAQRIRTELPKPYFLKKKEVEGIIESVVQSYESILNKEKIENFYQAAPQISGEITDLLPDTVLTLKDAEEEFEKKFLLKVLDDNEFDVKKTSKQIKLNHETLVRKMKKFNISKDN